MRFYTELFGWEAEDAMPPDSPERYFVCTLRDRRVAAVGEEPGGGPPRVAAWGTHIWVESADDTATRVFDAGGRVVVPPYDLVDAARAAVLADPAGAIFCLLEPREHRGAQLVNEPGAWSMSQLIAGDADEANAFYGAVFGWEADRLDLGGTEVTMWRLPGYVGGEPEQPVSREIVAAMTPIGSHGFPDGAAPHWSPDFWVADTDATADRCAGLGGAVVSPPTDIPAAGLRQALLADPQGASFSVTKVG
jgi:predicted enzyme related to lactoylglutathione lyase